MADAIDYSSQYTIAEKNLLDRKKALLVTLKVQQNDNKINLQLAQTGYDTCTHHNDDLSAGFCENGRIAVAWWTNAVTGKQAQIDGAEQDYLNYKSSLDVHYQEVTHAQELADQDHNASAAQAVAAIQAAKAAQASAENKAKVQGWLMTNWPVLAVVVIIIIVIILKLRK